MNASRPARAAFLDRDGVINVDHGYVCRPEDFDWTPGVVEALGRLQRAGFALVVVTNQSGIARGYYTEAQYRALADWMAAALEREGVHLSAQYHCPHLADAPLAQWRSRCNCRKPAPGMILRALADLRLDAAASWIFGDKPHDLQAGWAAGLGQGVLLRDPASGAAAIPPEAAPPPGARAWRHLSLAEAVAARWAELTAPPVCDHDPAANRAE